ncbi:MAG: DJ-1/PfpI family protein [Candidatus Dojkabacteria bacterium]|jgi:protease I|nr:DJ-1/PfpI family protein [Candidatus Dojkabacteria bacterium]
MATNKILQIIAPFDYRDEELEVPKKVFEEAGYKIEIASKNVSTATGMLGGKTTIDLDISDVIASDYAAVVFIGGSGTIEYFGDHDIMRIAKESYKSGLVLGAICIAPTILAKAGLLQDKKVTSFPSEKETLEKNGAQFTGELVTVDEKVITAKGPEAAREFGEKIVELLKN